jgi:hypothetical protein
MGTKADRAVGAMVISPALQRGVDGPAAEGGVPLGTALYRFGKAGESQAKGIFCDTIRQKREE